MVEQVTRELQKYAQDVICTLVSIEKQISASDERWFNVRVRPYHTVGNLLDGTACETIERAET